MSMKKALEFAKGMTFSFEDDGKTIEARFSAWSGVEKVYVNGEVVFSRLNLWMSMSSTNRFFIGLDEYEIDLKLVSVWKGPFVCTLIKNGKKLARREMKY